MTIKIDCNKLRKSIWYIHRWQNYTIKHDSYNQYTSLYSTIPEFRLILVVREGGNGTDRHIEEMEDKNSMKFLTRWRDILGVVGHFLHGVPKTKTSLDDIGAMVDMGGVGRWKHSPQSAEQRNGPQTGLSIMQRHGQKQRQREEWKMKR